MTEVRKRKPHKDKTGNTNAVPSSRMQSALGQIKESQSKGVMRHIMTACKVILAVLLVPPFLNYAALQRESTVLKPEGEYYDIGWGQKLFLSCKGKGAPTVVFDAPTGMNSDAWSLIVDKVAKTTRVCTYDRAGLGFSERPFKNSSVQDGTDSKSNVRNRWTPFTAERMVEDLHQLITKSSDQPKPFILVGAELGALVAQFYTHMFDQDVSNLILINPLTEDLFKQDDGIWIQNWFGHLVPSYQTIQLGAAIGLTRFAIMLGLLQHPMYMSKSMSEETVTRQTIQFGAAIGLTRFAIMLGLLQHPMYMSKSMSEETVTRQMSPLACEDGQTVQLGAAIGLTRFAIMLGLLQHPMYMSKSMSEETVTRQKYLMCQPRHLSSVVDEHYFINETFSQFRTARMIRSIPENISVTVITGNYYDEQMPGPLNKAWAKSEQNLITNTYPNSQHIVVNGGDRHMLYQNPDAIVEPVRKAVRQWRNKYGKVRDS